MKKFEIKVRNNNKVFNRYSYFTVNAEDHADLMLKVAQHRLNGEIKIKKEIKA